MNFVVRSGLLSALVLLLQIAPTACARAETSFNLRVMAANLNGNTQSYQPFALRIFQGLKPDVVAIQEFNYGNNTPADFRSMLDQTFGTNFVYFRETNSGYSIPNGIISRFPIVAAGSWDDSRVSDRGFAWAQLRLPGSNDLYVVSVHLLSSGTAADRNTEATAIKSLVQANLPANAWVVVAGDFNTDTRTEAAVSTFKTFLSDDPIPTDAQSGGNPDTNEPRSKPYDYVLPSFPLAAFQTNTVLPTRSFPKGLVFDSRIYTPLSDVAPVLSPDSGLAQHMAVVKDFCIDAGTNLTRTAPVITSPPASQNVEPGATAAFSVTASGFAPLSYQWLFFGTNIYGATQSTLTKTNVQAADAGNYCVVVSNDVAAVTSAVAVLTVNTAPENTNQGAVIAQWTFNSVPPDGATTSGTVLPAIGSGTASLVGGTTATFAVGSSTDTNAPSDNSGWLTTTYPAATSGSKSAGVKFAVSTAGRQNIVVHWDHRASNSGSKYARLQYTLDGSAFIDFPSAVSVRAADTYEPTTNNLSAVSGVNNNPNFAFRIVSEFESTAANTTNAKYVSATSTSTYGSSGTIRFDLVTILGDPIPTATAPVITSAPVGQQVEQGGTAQFIVGAAGTPTPGYQWRFNATNIPGATGTAYMRSNVQPTDVGFYSVLVTNSAGTNLSGDAELRLVIPRPFLASVAAGALQWKGLSNFPYTVQACDDLSRLKWTNVGTVSSASGVLGYTNMPWSGQRYYRVYGK